MEDDTASLYRWRPNGAEQRPSTTSSTESIPLSEWGDFISDIRAELIEQCGAAGHVSRQQLATIFMGMGLDISDTMLGGLWEVADEAPSASCVADGGAAAAAAEGAPASAKFDENHTLSVHEIIAHIAHRVHLRTPSDTTSTPSRPSSTMKARSKLRTPGSAATATVSAATWWGHPTPADLS